MVALKGFPRPGIKNDDVLILAVYQVGQMAGRNEALLLTIDPLLMKFPVGIELIILRVLGKSCGQSDNQSHYCKDVVGFHDEGFRGLLLNRSSTFPASQNATRAMVAIRKVSTPYSM